MQPRTGGIGRRMVLYPTSGDIMRAARTVAGHAVVDSTLYWFVAADEPEAGYLVSLLNASYLERAFRKSRRSGRHFHQHPWRKVPIQRFDPKDQRHVELAELCTEAESEAVKVRNLFPKSGQVKVSKEIRRQLTKCGIADLTNKLARDLMPDQVDS